MSQFQKEKNYQIEMRKIKNDEELNRLKRDYENKVESMQREIASRQLSGRQLNDRYAFLETKAQEARKQLENYELELMKLRD